ncbi:TonB-dependent outer membrane receptor [Nonlabens dokdonensis DSW-6]|uniref:TonB-dependent outer membrane receptor n=1 Tax=Nonlabens dokdonensis (strain DSM 17205 / KCTC 12402 / DSW-6) TaxID=592029 RepID=L7WES4_NONDD|nr:TonB-dependent outer membrane receptor [Nonlabens dokdonensis DSW-6]
MVAIALLISFCYSNAQTCDITLKGKITDFHDAQPLELAQIYVVQLQKTYISKADGTYEINGLCSGTYDLSVSHYDCDTKKLSVQLEADKIVDIKLEHHISDLDEVRVIADVHDNHSSTQSSTRIKSETIEKFSGASLGDALATVQGVTSLKTGNSVVKPVIHGLYGSRVAIVNDGLRQQDQEWGVEHAPNIDVNSANNIEVIKGASALRYGGDAIGGTIVIEPSRVISKDTLMGRAILQGQTNGRGGSATATVNNYRNSGWYQQATLTYKRLGDFESPDYILSNTGSETAAFNAALGFKKFEYGASLKYSFYDTEIGILRASHIGNAADLVTSINSGQPTIINDFTYDVDAPKQAVQHHGIQFNTYRRFAGLGKLDVDYAFQFNNRKEFDIRRGDNAGRASLDIDLQTHTIAGHLLIDSLEDFTVQIGTDAMYQLNSPDAATGVRRLIPDYTAYRLGGFTSALYEPNEKWILDAGVRFDYYQIDADKFYLQSRWEDLGYDTQYPQFEVNEQGNQILTNPVLDYNLLAFTAGAKYFFSDHYDLGINLSAANRAPNPSELFSDGLHHALATIELGSLDLEKEQSFKINTNFHVQEGKFDFEVNPYLNRVQNFIQLIPTGVETTNRGAFPVFEYEQVNALLYGIDAHATYDFYTRKPSKEMKSNPNEIIYNLKKLISLSTSFSYIHGTDTSNDQALIDMPPVQIQNDVIWHDVADTGINFQLTHQYVWQQNRFPDNDYEVLVPLDDGTFENRTVQISQTPEAYSLWNAGISYAFAKAKLSITSNNIFNTSYRNYLNRQRFYADEVGRDIQVQFIYNL